MRECLALVLGWLSFLSVAQAGYMVGESYTYSWSLALVHTEEDAFAVNMTTPWLQDKYQEEMGLSMSYQPGPLQVPLMIHDYPHLPSGRHQASFLHYGAIRNTEARYYVGGSVGQLIPTDSYMAQFPKPYSGIIGLEMYRYLSGSGGEVMSFMDLSLTKDFPYYDEEQDLMYPIRSWTLSTGLTFYF